MANKPYIAWRKGTDGCADRPSICPGQLAGFQEDSLEVKHAAVCKIALEIMLPAPCSTEQQTRHFEPEGRDENNQSSIGTKGIAHIVRTLYSQSIHFSRDWSRGVDCARLTKWHSSFDLLTHQPHRTIIIACRIENLHCQDENLRVIFSALCEPLSRRSANATAQVKNLGPQNRQREKKKGSSHDCHDLQHLGL